MRIVRVTLLDWNLYYFDPYVLHIEYSVAAKAECVTHLADKKLGNSRV